jgi:hypothetical protein
MTNEQSIIISQADADAAEYFKRKQAQAATPKGLALDKSTAALTPTPPVTPVQKTATQTDVEGLANYILDEAQRQNKVCTRDQALNAARTILQGRGYIIK